MYSKKGAKFVKLLAASLLFFALCYYIAESSRSHAPYVYETFSKTTDCKAITQRLKKLENLTQVVHDALESEGMSHFLIYGSIWGPLRGYEGPLPWDSDVDFGMIITESTLCKLNSLLMRLQEQGVAHQDHIKSAGLIRFYFAGEKRVEGKTIDLFLYQPTAFGMVRRVGYEFWLLMLHYYLHHTFPYHLVQEPMDKVMFSGRKIQIPRDGVEIMKYLYRYDWWVNKKPTNFNCSTNDDES